MSLQTLAYALASRPLVLFCFSGTTGTSSQYLPTAGGIAADGMPVPFGGTLLNLSVFDGTTVHNDTGNIAFTANDRLSIYCQNVGGTYSVKIRLNGISTVMQVDSVPLSSTLQVTITAALNRI
ncbi:MAG: hypothetical protein H6505_03285 [Calditrichaeota bacterium]|nr:hypothetical protein [Calditrichota bacterium]